MFKIIFFLTASVKEAPDVDPQIVTSSGLVLINMIDHKATQKLIYVRLSRGPPRQHILEPLISTIYSTLRCTLLNLMPCLQRTDHAASSKLTSHHGHGLREPELEHSTAARYERKTPVRACWKDTNTNKENPYSCGRTQNRALPYSRSVSILSLLDDECTLTLAADALDRQFGYVPFNLDYVASRMTRLTSDSAKILHGRVRLYGTTCDKILFTTLIPSRFTRITVETDVYHYSRRSGQDASVLRLMSTSTKVTCWSATPRIIFARKQAYAPCT